MCVWQEKLEEGEGGCLWPVSVGDYSSSKICWRPLKKGICNFPPPQMYSCLHSYPSPLPLYFLLVFPLFTLLFLISVALMSQCSPTFSACFVRGCVVYLKPLIETTQMTCFVVTFCEARLCLWHQIKFNSLSLQISATQRSYLYCVNHVIPRRRRKSWRMRRRMIWSWRVLC